MRKQGKRRLPDLEKFQVNFCENSPICRKNLGSFQIVLDWAQANLGQIKWVNSQMFFDQNGSK